MISTHSSRRGCFHTSLHIVLLLTYFAGFTDAGVSCDSDKFCQDLYNTNSSVCLSTTKECSNPFQRGCLRSKGIIGDRTKTNYGEVMRVCTSVEESPNSSTNSSDNAENEEMCVPSNFTYPEIRIHNADWVSSYMIAWIYQIVLVEILGVPATVGLTTETAKSMGFYAANNTIQFSSEAYPYDALKNATKMFQRGETCGDTADKQCNCEHTEDPCVHVLPEVLNGQFDKWDTLYNDGEIARPTSNGMVDKQGLTIPKKTAEEYPSLGLFYGLQNQSQLAKIFKKPTNWGDYCEKVSPEKCAVEDDFSTRKPTEEEKSLYFLEGSYKGYFFATEKNNCTASDSLDDCHGYVVGPPCDWSSFVEAQVHWNSIGLKLDGPEGYNKAYNYSSMVEIWKAANATGSHVIMWWWLADLDAQAFGNSSSSYSPQMVQLPQPSQECLENRLKVAERCSADPATRLGSPLGSCDQEYSQLQRLISSSVSLMNNVPPVEQSAATAMLDALKVTEYDIIEILENMLAKGADQFKSNAREAVCDWVADHISDLEEIIPPTYPKHVVLSFANGLSFMHYLAQATACIVGFIAVACIILTCKYSETKTMTFAQPTFMYLILSGFCLICMAAFMLAVIPQDHVCLGLKWFEVVGFGIQLIPVLIKTAALNKLISSSKKQQRINIDRRTLLRKVTYWMIFIIICMVAWTVTDPPRVATFRTLDKEDPSVVIIDRECTSDGVIWEIVQSAMELLLLFICAILAFQSRNAISVVNDSRVLAQLVYSHFLFVIFRVLVTAFDISDLFPGDLIPILASFNHSGDALFAMCIYVVPKIFKAKYEEPLHMAKMAGQYSSTRLKTDKNLKILICTANMGNAEPTRESMESWIPVDGACFHVTPLQGVTKELGKGRYFDIIVIGMQESTWARKETKALAEKEAAKSTSISEEDILNALDKHDSATIRVMVQDIIGTDFNQIVEETRGQMRLSIWASINIEEDIKNVRISGANTGIGNVLSNKGGIVATIDYRTTRLSFISAHLAAHEGDNYFKNRLQNIRSILREGKTSDLSSKLDVTMTSHHMFLLGDLNFRTKFEDPTLAHEKCVQRAMNLVDFKDYEALYMYDELQQALRNGELLHDFKTLPCDFPPTFKVQREPGFVYKAQRTPSYTDRIVYKSMDGFQSHLEPLAYEPCVDFITSDHKPIRGAFSILPSDEIKSRAIQGKFILKIAKIQASGLPSSDSSGKADPYVMLMWEGVDLHPQHMSFKDRMKKYYNGRFWPRTGICHKTLDAFWDEDVIHVEGDNPTIQKGSFLHLVVVDHDNVTRDDFMCAATLSLWDFCNHGTITHDLSLPLTREGTHAGTIKFKLYVGIPERTTRPVGAVGAVRRASAVIGRRFIHAFDTSNRDDDHSTFLGAPQSSNSPRSPFSSSPFKKSRSKKVPPPQDWQSQLVAQDLNDLLDGDDTAHGDDTEHGPKRLEKEGSGISSDRVRSNNRNPSPLMSKPKLRQTKTAQ